MCSFSLTPYLLSQRAARKALRSFFDIGADLLSQLCFAPLVDGDSVRHIIISHQSQARTHPVVRTDVRCRAWRALHSHRDPSPPLSLSKQPRNARPSQHQHLLSQMKKKRTTHTSGPNHTGHIDRQASSGKGTSAAPARAGNKLAMQ